MRLHFLAPFLLAPTIALASCQMPSLTPDMEISEDAMVKVVAAYTVTSGEGLGRTLEGDEQKMVLAHVREAFGSGKSPDFTPFYWNGDKAQPQTTQELGDAVFHVLDRLCATQIDALTAPIQKDPKDQDLRDRHNALIKEIDVFKRALNNNWSLAFEPPKDREEVMKEFPLPSDIYQSR